MTQRTADIDREAMQLLMAFRQGDGAAFSRLYNMFAAMMLHYGMCLTADRELVKDCMQDVFVRMLDNSRPLNVKRVSSYLIISLRNRLMDEFRRASFASHMPVDKLAMRSDGGDAECELINRQTEMLSCKQLDHLLAKLTPRQREAFQLYYLEGREYAEVCERMHLNYHSIRNLVHRGMVRMRAATTE